MGFLSRLFPPPTRHPRDILQAWEVDDAGTELVYSFSQRVSSQRAFSEFARAKEQGRPSGSVIIIED